MNPQDADAYNNRGTAYRDKGELNTAIQDYDTAIELNPQDANAYYNRGIAYADKGEVDTAIQDFSTAIGLNSKFAIAYNNRGNAYRDKGELNTAIQDYDTAIELNPQDANAYNNRGVVYRDKGEFDKAIQDFSTAISLKPKHLKSYTNRVLAWLHLSEWEKAKSDLITAKNIGVDIAGLFHNAYGSVADFEVQQGVKVPEDIAALLNPHFEEEIKQRSAVETKPLVQTEGPLDVRYIQRALDVLGEAELLNSLDIEFVGIIDENGRTRFGGDTGLNHFRNLYEANPSLFHRPILLLYDCDTQKPNEQVEKLWVRSIPKNDENTKVSKGIENLFPEALFYGKFLF